MAFDPNDPDTKAALKAAVEEATADLAADIDSIKKNRDQLLKEKKELQRSATITPEQLAAVEAERDKAAADLAAAQKAAKDATTLADKANKALEQESGFTHKLLAENGIVAALTAAGVTDPAYLDAAKALHLPNVKVVAEGDTRSALYGDKPLADAIKEWAAGDVGKKFVAAPNNGGGGAPGGKGGTGGKTMTQADFNSKPPKERAAFMAEGGQIVDQAA